MGEGGGEEGRWGKALEWGDLNRRGGEEEGGWVGRREKVRRGRGR